MERKTNGLCVSGFVISLVSLVLCGGLLSLLSLILSIVGVVKVNKNGDNGKGLGVAGIIISAVTIVLSVHYFLEYCTFYRSVRNDRIVQLHRQI